MTKEELKKNQKLLKQIDRKLCKENLWFLAYEILEYKDIDNDFHKEFCKYIDEDNDSRSLYLLPRSHLKTSLLTIAKTIQIILQNSDARILIAGNSLGNAKGFLKSIKTHFIHNKKLRALFPECAVSTASQEGTTEKFTIPSRKNLKLKEATVEVIGANSRTAGRHYTHIFLDDVVDSINTATKDLIDKTSEWYDFVQILLEVPSRDRITILGTRYDYKDLYGKLIDDGVKTYLREAFDEEGNCLWPERFNKTTLNKIKKSIGTYKFSCNPYESPVLMDDWSSKKIGTIKKGEYIIGWKTSSTGRKELVKSKVLEIGNKNEKIYKIYLKSGRVIRCTKDHKWYTGRGPSDKTHPEYKEAKVGSKLLFIMEPYLKELTSYEQRQADWLGGFFDGEGSCSSSALSISQSHIVYPHICKKLEDVLSILKYDYKKYIRTKHPISHHDCTMYSISGGIETKRRFILECNPAKRKNIEVAMFKRSSKRFIKEKDEVVKIEYDRTDTVYSIQTETGNYIIWGYASKNCQYQNSPIDKEKQDFKPYWLENKTIESIEYIAKTIVVDPAIETKKQNDFSAFSVVGWTIDREMHILETFKGKLNPTELQDKIFYFHMKYTRARVGIEKAGFQKYVVINLQDEQRRRGIYFQIKELEHKGINKHERIRQLIPYFERGAVYNIPDDLKSELESFPKARHEDLLDSLAYHLYMLENIPWIRKRKETETLDTNTLSYILKMTGAGRKSEPKELDDDLPTKVTDGESYI